MNTTYQFVKASERLPEGYGKHYFCHVLNKITGDTHKSVVYKAEKNFDLDDSVFIVLQWLEEIPSPPTPEGETAPNIKDFFPDANLYEMHQMYITHPQMWAYVQALEKYAKQSTPVNEKSEFEQAINEVADNQLNERLNNGRHYLMGVQAEELTVEDALEAFGFNRNGIGLKSF